jgi:hypothetical protein
MDDTVSKKVGGQTRADAARHELKKIFKSDSHPMYLYKDIELANHFSVARHTIYSIREELGIPPRTERIIKKLKNMDTNKYTINELSAMLKIKYQNLYKVLTEDNIPVKPDTPPIEAMIKYQKSRKKKIT